MENERDFKGIWIPKEIYLSQFAGVLQLEVV